MVITIDTQASELRLDGRTISLYSEEAFEVITREWLRLGWNRDHYAQFFWMGRQILQLPQDALCLVDAVWRVRPDVVVETGVFDGGSACLFATVCRMAGHGRVIAIERDVRPGVREALERFGVALVEGDSADPAIVSRVRGGIEPGESVFVFLDSDHCAAHVRAELRAYAPLVTSGSYVVVADTNLSDLADTPQGERAWLTDNPASAVAEFLRDHQEFALRPPPEGGTVSYFSGGWLLRR